MIESEGWGQTCGWRSPLIASANLTFQGILRELAWALAVSFLSIDLSGMGAAEVPDNCQWRLSAHLPLVFIGNRIAPLLTQSSHSLVYPS